MRELRRVLRVPFGLPATTWMVRLGAPLIMRTDAAEAGISNGFPRGNELWTLSFQFFLAVVFIQVMMVMSNQNKYIFSDDIKKYNADNVICIPGSPWGDLKKVKEELLKNPAIEIVSWGSSIPTMGFSATTEWKDDHNKVMAVKKSLGLDFPEVYRIKMASGRFFSDEYGSDRNNSIVINQETADELEFSDPLNKMMIAYGKQYKIIGVIDNYMAIPPIFDNMPLLITQSGDQNNYLVMRINSTNREATHEYIVNTMHKFNPDHPVEVKYHNDVYSNKKNLNHTFRLVNL